MQASSKVTELPNPYAMEPSLVSYGKIAEMQGTPVLHCPRALHACPVTAPKVPQHASASIPDIATVVQSSVQAKGKKRNTQSHELRVQRAVAKAIQVLRFALCQQGAQVIGDCSTMEEKWQRYRSRFPQGDDGGREPSLSARALCTQDGLDCGELGTQRFFDSRKCNGSDLLQCQDVRALACGGDVHWASSIHGILDKKCAFQEVHETLHHAGETKLSLMQEKAFGLASVCVEPASRVRYDHKNGNPTLHAPHRAALTGRLEQLRKQQMENSGTQLQSFCVEHGSRLESERQSPGECLFSQVARSINTPEHKYNNCRDIADHKADCADSLCRSGSIEQMDQVLSHSKCILEEAAQLRSSDCKACKGAVCLPMACLDGAIAHEFHQNLSGSGAPRCVSQEGPVCRTRCASEVDDPHVHWLWPQAWRAQEQFAMWAPDVGIEHTPFQMCQPTRLPTAPVALRCTPRSKRKCAQDFLHRSSSDCAGSILVYGACANQAPLRASSPRSSILDVLTGPPESPRGAYLQSLHRQSAQCLPRRMQQFAPPSLLLHGSSLCPTPDAVVFDSQCGQDIIA
jgi:hypothetical protein